MNVDSAQQIKSSSTQTNSSYSKSQSSDSNFADELSKLKANDCDEKEALVKNTTDGKETKTEDVKEYENLPQKEQDSEECVEGAINGIQGVVQEIQRSKENLGQTEENQEFLLQKKDVLSDNDDKHEDNNLINNDINIQESQDKFTPQMNAQMNFNSNGQPFSAFVEQSVQQLSTTEKDLAEENEILSTMSENIAIANRNMIKSATQNISVLEENNNDNVTQKVKTVENAEGIKKVSTKDNITVETVVRYDSVIMDKNDVEFFAQLVDKGTVDANFNVENAAKSSQVSKTLADLIAKSMKDNQPVRIDFDNDISVIIKISKDGKISADFLPSSQIAEAYLKENLPILKQRFDDNNINYDELNQRKQQKQDNKDDRKKGRKDE